VFDGVRSQLKRWNQGVKAIQDIAVSAKAVRP
jgi:hypothetical protein